MILYDGWFCSARSDSADLCWSMLIYWICMNLRLLPAADRADGALWSALHLAGALSLGMARIGPLLQVLRRLEEWRSNLMLQLFQAALWKLGSCVILCDILWWSWRNESTSAACNSICNWILLLLLAACTGTWSRHATYTHYISLQSLERLHKLRAKPQTSGFISVGQSHAKTAFQNVQSQ